MEGTSHMRTVFGQALVAAGIALALGSGQSASAQNKTTWDGVYSAAQATRGGDLYAKNCASCHKPDLSGNDSVSAPPLVAKELGLSFGDSGVDVLASRIQTTMPKDKPRTLTAAQATDIVAFLLQKGGMPAGSAELSSDAAAQKTITFVPTKP